MKAQAAFPFPTIVALPVAVLVLVATVLLHVLGMKSDANPVSPPATHVSFQN